MGIHGPLSLNEANLLGESRALRKLVRQLGLKIQMDPDTIVWLGKPLEMRVGLPNNLPSPLRDTVKSIFIC